MKQGDKREDVKSFMGMPMNWDKKRPFKNLWNKDDDRLFPPKSFGVGWTINFHAVLNSLGLIKKKNGKEDQSQ